MELWLYCLVVIHKPVLTILQASANIASGKCNSVFQIHVNACSCKTWLPFLHFTDKFICPLVFMKLLDKQAMHFKTLNYLNIAIM